MSLHRLALVLMAALLAMGGTDAVAQQCRTDVDCRRTGLRADTRCVGDTLVVTHYRCIGGTCRGMDTRQSCAMRSAGRCIGNVFEATIGRCDALLGRCVERTERDVCMSSCTCRDNVLTVAMERCSPDIGCQRARIVCKVGCTCDPEPRCLDEPAEKSREQEKPAGK